MVDTFGLTLEVISRPYSSLFKKIIHNSEYLNGKVISRSFKFQIANIMPSLRFRSVIILD